MKKANRLHFPVRLHLAGILFLLLVSGCEQAPSHPALSERMAEQHNRFNDFMRGLTEASSQPVQPLPETVPFDKPAAQLGKELYFAPQLSANGTVSCATCHIIQQGGDDNRPVSIGIHGRKGELNAPTVLNSGFNLAQFWDGRAATLEEQALHPLVTPHEMGNQSVQVVADRLNADSKWRQKFIQTFGEPASPQAIAYAIAEYERTLITPGSRFDRYLLGDHDALTPQERRGWKLFQSYGCIGCHQGINLGGSMFQKAGIYHPLGVRESRWLGRYNVTHREEDRHVFKVPTLRNVAETAPYFHDGSVPTLEKAVTLMIEAQLGKQPRAQVVADITAFLKTLSAPPKDLLHGH